MDVMELIGFLIVFGLLAALVGTLATGVLRIIGFGILVALALIIGTPYLQNGAAVRNPFGTSARTPTARPQDTTASPNRPGSNTVPNNVGSGAGGFSTTGPVENERTQTQGFGGQGGTSGSGGGRGVPAMW